MGNIKGPLRTVGEVLEVMIEQNEVAARLEERMVRPIPRDPFANYLGDEGFPVDLFTNQVLKKEGASCDCFGLQI